LQQVQQKNFYDDHVFMMLINVYTDLLKKYLDNMHLSFLIYNIQLCIMQELINTIIV